MATIAGDTSVYNADTDWENEAAYLKNLISTGTEGEKAWATNQYAAFEKALTQYGNTDTTSTAQDTQSMINEQYDNYLASQLASLQSSYDQNLNALNTAESQIGTEYATQRDTAAVQSAQAQRAFNEYANARGLNTGASAQSTLARQNTLQGALGDINAAEAQAYTDIATQKANLLSEYNAALAEAQATGNYNKLSALYTDYVRLEEQEQSATSTIADTGWTLLNYGQIPSDEQLSAMGITYDQAVSMLAATTSTTGTGSGSGTTTMTLSQLDSDIQDMYSLYDPTGYGTLTAEQKTNIYNYITTYGGQYADQLLSKYGLSGYTGATQGHLSTYSGLFSTVNSALSSGSRQEAINATNSLWDSLTATQQASISALFGKYGISIS